VREPLTSPPLHSRGHGARIAAALRAATLAGRSAAGLLDAARYLGRRAALVLLVSDFHFELAFTRRVLATLAGHFVVPVVVWDAAEAARTLPRGWIEVADSESAETRFLWLRPQLAERIRAAAAARRDSLAQLFRALGLRPLYLAAGFSPERATRYFFGLDDAP
jgi:hypothetical protein